MNGLSLSRERVNNSVANEYKMTPENRTKSNKAPVDGGGGAWWMARNLEVLPIKRSSELLWKGWGDDDILLLLFGEKKKTYRKNECFVLYYELPHGTKHFDGNFN